VLAKLRPGSPADAPVCGRICYEAFTSISTEHAFPPDFPAPEVAVELLSMMLGHPGFYSVVAEVEGTVVGSNFLDERSTIAGVGPITVAPDFQNASIGRQLMEAVMERAAQRRVPGVRLVQAAYHNRSLSLYAKLGFSVREPLACLQGPPPARGIPGYTVRQATPSDANACNRVCTAVHGHDRAGELADAIAQGSALVVEHEGRVTGYSTALAFFGHSVGDTTTDIEALICAVSGFGGPGILVPMRNAQLLRFCLDAGLRVVQMMNLMSLGLYQEPSGAWLPSVLF